MTRIFIENNEMDIDKELSYQITYAIDDLQQLDSKSTPFTKTIILPGTTKNNSLLGNIFEFTNSNFTIDVQPNVGYNYNAAKAAKCRIEVNGLQIIKGVIRLMEIIIDGNFIEYECAVFGELGGFCASLSNKKVEDLDFSEYDHIYDLGNIVGSWDQQARVDLGKTITFSSIGNVITTPFNYQNYPPGTVFVVTGTANNNGTYTVVSNNGQPNVDIVVAETLVSENCFGRNVRFTSTTVTPEGTGYYYPLIDYGNVSTDKHNYQYTAFRPALYLREFLDKIITGNGYTWECAFWDTAYFKRLIIPNNDKSLFKFGVTEYIDADYTGGDTISTGYPVTLPPYYPMPIPFASSTLNNFTTSDGGKTFVYSGIEPINTKVSVRVTGVYKQKPQTYFGTQYFGNISIQTTQGSSYVYLPDNTNLPKVPGAPAYSYFDVTVEYTGGFIPGDAISVYMDTDPASFPRTPDRYVICFAADLSVAKEPPGFVELPLGDPVTINIGLPKGILQKDFFISILKMFYLMVTEDKFVPKKLVITPYVQFFNTDRSTFLDWSDKIDRGSPIKIKPMSETNARFYEVGFAKDSDYYNEDYRKKYNLGYGDVIFDTAYDFAKETEKVAVIFAASVLFAASGEDKVTPAIFKRSGDVEEQIAHVVRIMQKKKITGVSSWDILNGVTVLGSYTDYPYAGHFDDPDLPDQDINFGATKELYFVLVAGNLTNNLFNIFYSPYMAEITDKDSRLLKAKFKLSKQDIYDLNFSRFVFIDGGLFRLSKVVDYNTNGEDLTAVELLRVINTTY
jgi:hypothetical protein